MKNRHDGQGETASSSTSYYEGDEAVGAVLGAGSPRFGTEGEIIMSNSKYGTIQATSDAKLREGLAAHNKKSERFKVKGEEVNVGEALTMLERRAAALRAVDDARAAFHAAVRAQRQIVDASESALAAVRQHLSTLLDDRALAAYGMAPKKGRGTLTIEERAVAAAKMRATRAQRGMMGPKQRRQAEAVTELAHLAAAATNGHGDGAAPAPAAGEGEPPIGVPKGVTTQ
jgi:hypothetical protein